MVLDYFRKDNVNSHLHDSTPDLLNMGSLCNQNLDEFSANNHGDSLPHFAWDQRACGEHRTNDQMCRTKCGSMRDATVLCGGGCAENP